MSWESGQGTSLDWWAGIRYAGVFSQDIELEFFSKYIEFQRKYHILVFTCPGHFLK